MVVKKKNNIIFYSFIACIVFVGVHFGHLFILPPSRASIVWPAIGLIFGFRYSLGRKVWPYVIAGYFLGHVVNEFLISNNAFYMAVLIAGVMSVVLVGANEIGIRIASYVRYEPKVTLYSSLKYSAVAVGISLFMSIFGSLFYMSLGFISFSGYFESAFIWFLGDFFSIVGFGLPVIYSMKFDRRLTSRHGLILGIVYVLFLGLILILLTDLVPVLNFRNHKFVLALFFFILAFYFTYRTIYLFHLILLTSMIVFSPFDSTVNYLRLLMEVNVFIALMSVTTITIKYHIHAININKETISAKAERLDLLLNALDNLLTMPSESNKLEHHDINDHLSQMFRMVFTLFDKADYGSCMIIDDTIEFIDGIGFDIEVLNALKLEGMSRTSYHLEDPYIKTQAETFLKRDLGPKDYATYKMANPAIKESLYVGFRISKEIICEMSFDLVYDSDAYFTQDDLSFFSSLQTLFGSFYETEKVTREYSALKNDIILSLLRTLELFDKQAGTHSMDVALIAQQLAEKMGLHEGMINDIYWAGIVHDIGKLGIDMSVLKKDSMYTVNDYEIMQEHSLLSYQILSKSGELKSIASIVKYHHEWVDGSGYPDQIIGSEIPLASRILHVAESVAVMMRDWSYQAARSDQEIIEELNNKKATQFDPKCVDAMTGLIQESVLEHVKKTNRAD